MAQLQLATDYTPKSWIPDTSQAGDIIFDITSKTEGMRPVNETCVCFFSLRTNEHYKEDGPPTSYKWSYNPYKYGL